MSASEQSSSKKWVKSHEYKPTVKNGDSSFNWRNPKSTESTESTESSEWTTVSQQKHKKSHRDVKLTNSVNSDTKCDDDKSKSHAYNVKKAIRNWASSAKSTIDMIEEYSLRAKSWEAEKFASDNKLTMIKELSRNLRHDVLKELIQMNPKFGSSLPLKGYTPLQYVGYPDKHTAQTAILSDLISTASVLIDLYGFKTFVNCSENTGHRETMYGSLQTRHNPLPEDLRITFYDYLTEKAPSSWFFPNFNGNLNKLTESNFEVFHNKLVMVLSRFPEEVAQIVFSKLMGRAPKTELLKQVKLVIGSLLSELNDTDCEMNRYFEKVDLELQKMKFVKEFLTSGDKWILEDASCYDIGSEEHNDRIVLNTRIYYAALGSIYLEGYVKKEIMENMNKILEEHVRPTWFSRAVTMFLIHANIGAKSICEIELNFFTNFIKKCYKTGSVRDKIDIENGLELSVGEISELIADVKVCEEQIKVNVFDTGHWDKILDEVGDEIADFD